MDVAHVSAWLLRAHHSAPNGKSGASRRSIMHERTVRDRCGRRSALRCGRTSELSSNMTVSAQALLRGPRTTVFHAPAKRLKVNVGNIAGGERIFTQPTSDDSNAHVLLVQSPHDDGLDMYVEFLHYHRLAPMPVTNAHDALDLAPTAAVIVTGILLAGSSMDGIGLIGRLRSDDRTKNTPIIVLTACAWPSDRARAGDAGCDVFLPKPCLPDELLREVRRLLVSSCGTPISPPTLRKAMPDIRRADRMTKHVA